MAIKLDALDTHTVLVALHAYREEERADGYYERVHRIDRLIKSYRKSLAALQRWEQR